MAEQIEQNVLEAEIEHLRKKYEATRHIARTLAWVAAHWKYLRTREGMPRELNHAAELRAGKAPFYYINSPKLPDTMEALLHACSFRRDYNAPHHYYQSLVEKMVRNWSEDYADQLKDHLLEQFNILEEPDADALCELAEERWWRELEAVAGQRIISRERSRVMQEELRQRAIKESEDQLADLLTFAGTLGNVPTYQPKGVW